MQDILNLESWEGWAKYADNKYDKALFSFIDNIIDIHLTNPNRNALDKPPLAYNTESNVQPPQMVIDVLDFVSTHLTIPEMSTEVSYNAGLPYEWCSKNGIISDSCTIRFANLEYIRDIEYNQHFSEEAIKAIYQWWLNNDYTKVAYILIGDYGIQQYVIG